MKFLISLFFLLSIVSCSTQKEKHNIHKKAANETQVSDVKTLGVTINDLIASSKTLDEKQKQELTQIIAANKKRAEELSEESYKFRAVLIKSLLSEKVDKKEVRLLKKKIKKIEGLRLKNTFDTVEKITHVVSHDPDSQKYSDHLINMERAVR